MQPDWDSMQEEAAELINLARSLTARAKTHQTVLDALVGEMTENFARAKDPIAFERAAEDAARELRHVWLEASASSASSFYRSPPATETTKTATGRSVEFGYERDLQPTYLEERCNAFFGQPPGAWNVDHVLLSSGQSAMAAVLHALEGASLFGSDRKLSFAHLGSYFETAEIFTLFGSLLHSAGRGRQAISESDSLDADIFIVEPIFCDGAFGSVDVARLIEAHRKNGVRPRVYIFDTTLMGMSLAFETELERMRLLKPLAVFRLISGMKLFQAGLELSSVGVLSIFTLADGKISAKELGSRIRKIRTLLGLGLSFAEVAALEAPWFLNREYTKIYQQAIFENNARLAQAVSADNRLFRGVFHPRLLPGTANARDAPFCVFRLNERDDLAGVTVENYLRGEAQRRGILFELGGSFGFRGHRFEMVRPESGEEPFLRVALGRRTGRSCEQIIQLMREVSRVASVERLGPA